MLLWQLLRCHQLLTQSVVLLRQCLQLLLLLLLLLLLILLRPCHRLNPERQLLLLLLQLLLLAWHCKAGLWHGTDEAPPAEDAGGAPVFAEHHH
jgi:hypothetical protein